MDGQDEQDKDQEQDKCILFRAKPMDPYLGRATNITLLHQFLNS